MTPNLKGMARPLLGGVFGSGAWLLAKGMRKVVKVMRNVNDVDDGCMSFVSRTVYL